MTPLVASRTDGDDAGADAARAAVRGGGAGGRAAPGRRHVPLLHAGGVRGVRAAALRGAAGAVAAAAAAGAGGAGRPGAARRGARGHGRRAAGRGGGRVPRRAPQVHGRRRRPRRVGGVRGLRRQARRRHPAAARHGGALRQGAPRRARGGGLRARVQPPQAVHGAPQGRRRRGRRRPRTRALRRRRPAGPRHRTVSDGALLPAVLQGAAQAAVHRGGRDDERPAVPAGDLPRRPPGVPPHAVHVPRRPPLAAPRRAGRLRPHRRRPHGPHLDHPPHRAHLRRRRHHARPRASPRPRRRRRRLAVGRALRLHAPHAHGPRGPGHRARPPRRRCDLLHLPPLGGPVPDPAGAADARPGRGRGADARRAGPGRCRRVPRGHHLPGALPAALLGAVRGAQRPDRARGDELPGGALPPDDGARVEGHGPHLLLHEPEARVRGDVPEPAARGGDLRRREEPRGRGQLRAEDTGRHARVRVHQPHAEAQVQGARLKRRHRRQRRQAGGGAWESVVEEPRHEGAQVPAPRRAPLTTTNSCSLAEKDGT